MGHSACRPPARYCRHAPVCSQAPVVSEQLEVLLGYPWPFPGRPPQHDFSTWNRHRCIVWPLAGALRDPRPKVSTGLFQARPGCGTDQAAAMCHRGGRRPGFGARSWVTRVTQSMAPGVACQAGLLLDTYSPASSSPPIVM